MPVSHFLLSGLSIILIDLLLAGDNALVIAMAVRSLPSRERRLAIGGGAAGAVVLQAEFALGHPLDREHRDLDRQVNQEQDDAFHAFPRGSSGRILTPSARKRQYAPPGVTDD